MKKALIILVLLFGSSSPAQAFQYVNNQLTNSEFNSQNLLKNPWFRSSNCTFSGASWNLNDTTAGSEATWADSDKTQDPADPGQPNCNSDWWGFAARFAKGSGGIQFSSGKTAIMSQVVGESPTINPNDRTLHFHALMVAHRVYVFKAEIFGGNTKNGPWNLVWTPFNIVNCLTLDCVNATYGPACNQGDRQCLWDDVSSSPEILGTLDAKQQTISNGYPFYKIQFSMRYPDPNLDLQTGDVGGKVARVFFRVTGSGGTPVPTPTGPTAPPPSPTPTGINNPTATPTGIINPTPTPPPGDVSFMQIILKWLKSQLDQNGDGKVNAIDFGLLLQ